MKERPILFSAPMVRAILSGQKTMTRRVIKPQPIVSEAEAKVLSEARDSGFINIKCPYGEVGDRLWVRETWMPDPSCDDDAWDDAMMSYMEWDGCGMPMRNYPEALKSVNNVIHRASWDGEDMVGWKPSIHMPRWASRITLEIVSVRVERLNEISEQDAIAEGAMKAVKYTDGHITGDPRIVANEQCSSHQFGFEGLWKQINGADSWQQNPWVWIIEFKRITQ